MLIGGYFIISHWWLLMAILLVPIYGYFINGFCWLLYFMVQLLVIILL
jgi:hypothetical protein